MLDDLKSLDLGTPENEEKLLEISEKIEAAKITVAIETVPFTLPRCL